MQILIKVGTIKSQILGVLPSEIRGELKNQLSYDVQNAYFIKQQSKKDLSFWDGKCYLISARNIFYTGFLPRVKNILDSFKLPYKIQDMRGYSVDNLPFKLRDYQTDALASVLQEKRGILYMVPRSGKTIVDIAAALILKLYPKVFFCRSLDIAYQTMDKYKEFAPEINIGLVGDGKVDIKDVTLVTLQSAVSAFGEKYKWKRGEKKEKSIGKKEKKEVQDLITNARFVTYDECHHVASSVSQFIFDHLESAEYVIGLSGTPWREDNTDLLLEGLIGPIIYESSYSLLIEKGFLVAPTIYFVKVPSMSFPKKTPYSTVYKNYVVENVVRNVYVKKAAEGLSKKGFLVLIIVREIKHGEVLNEMVSDSVFLHGTDTSEKRKEVWADFRDKKVKILITTLADEGMDIPRLDTVINAAGGKSSILAYQRLRILTPYKNKERAIFVDFLDDAPYLLGHSKKKMKLYKKEEKFDVVIKEDF